MNTSNITNYKPNDFVALIDVSVATLQRWDRENISIRFGYDWFEKICNKFNTGIIVVRNEELFPNEELAQNIVSILHVFSCRLYGLRKYKNKIQEDEEIAKEL